jgi:dTDP-4-amino-4,6-dideoxygalactose transaminase
MKKDIETGIKYPPVHLFTMYGKEKSELPVAEKCYKEILELPLHCRLSDEDVRKVVAAVKEFF